MISTCDSREWRLVDNLGDRPETPTRSARAPLRVPARSAAPLRCRLRRAVPFSVNPLPIQFHIGRGSSISWISTSSRATFCELSDQLEVETLSHGELASNQFFRKV